MKGAALKYIVGCMVPSVVVFVYCGYHFSRLLNGADCPMLLLL